MFWKNTFSLSFFLFLSFQLGLYWSANKDFRILHFSLNGFRQIKTLTWSPNLYTWKCNLYYSRTQLLIQESQKTPACRYTARENPNFEVFFPMFQIHIWRNTGNGSLWIKYCLIYKHACLFSVWNRCAG